MFSTQVWTTTVRHPAKFALAKIMKGTPAQHRRIVPEFMLDMVLGANPAQDGANGRSEASPKTSREDTHAFTHV